MGAREKKGWMFFEKRLAIIRASEDTTSRHANLTASFTSLSEWKNPSSREIKYKKSKKENH